MGWPLINTNKKSTLIYLIGGKADNLLVEVPEDQYKSKHVIVKMLEENTCFEDFVKQNPPCYSEKVRSETYVRGKPLSTGIPVFYEMEFLRKYRSEHRDLMKNGFGEFNSKMSRMIAIMYVLTREHE